MRTETPEPVEPVRFPVASFTPASWTPLAVWQLPNCNASTVQVMQRSIQLYWDAHYHLAARHRYWETIDIGEQTAGACSGASIAAQSQTLKRRTSLIQAVKEPQQ